MGKKQEDVEQLPGLPYARFKAAVKVLAQLRDEGAFLIFLARGNVVRLVGKTEDFQDRLARELEQESVDRGDAEASLLEIQNFLEAMAMLRSVDRLVDVLERSIFPDDFEALGDDGKTRLRRLLKDKAELASSRLLTPALQQRADRLDTTVGPSLEEVDVEIVQDRQDELEKRRISAPFLRLRLRYSDAGDQTFPPLFFAFRGARRRRSASRSFEFEADETDIDLLLRRLIAAKDVLLRAIEERASLRG